jgi:hypothetical protein
MEYVNPHTGGPLMPTLACWIQLVRAGVRTTARRRTGSAVYLVMPDDRRARRGQMFGHPCAFVNGHMFHGTFAQAVVARVGAERAEALAGRGRPPGAARSRPTRIPTP